ncbi:hypothetical protein GCM10010446_23950 [Streptomyces enissocaesilis]|uniref:Uncharacterized protein n=1 Tax=Streptomyces enissocaesilis TaxID=332589 RepID=A0ABN3X5R2_9ACTN
MIEPYALPVEAREFYCLPPTARAQRCVLCGEIRLHEPEADSDAWKDHSTHCPDTPTPVTTDSEIRIGRHIHS